METRVVYFRQTICVSDPEVTEFFESKRDLPRATSTAALSSASVLRLLGKVGDTVNKMSAVKMEETDPWYEEKVSWNRSHWY